MAMLKRYPELNAKISQLMNDYIQALRSKDETPGLMLAMTEEAESAILDKYRIEMERKVAEKDRQRVADRQRKEQRAQEREKLREEKVRFEVKQQAEDTTKEQSKESPQLDEVVTVKRAEEEHNKSQTTEETTIKPSPTALPTVDDAAVQRAVEEVAAAVAHQEVEPRMQHALAHDFNHGEAVSLAFVMRC